MAVFLVCEGPRGGLDDRVLDALVVRPHGLAVLIETSGGGKGRGPVRHYLESGLAAPRDVAVAVGDRDYRQRQLANATWAAPTGKNFIWRRHEIENYLLEPRVVLELFNDFRTIGQAWVSSLPTTEADTSALLQRLATPLLADHAAEILKDELVQLLNRTGSLSFGPPTPTPPVNAPAPGQAEWLPALCHEAARLCQTCNVVAALPELEAGAITTRYGDLLTQFQAPTFLGSGEYLLDMGGKELLAALAAHLHGLGAPLRLTWNLLADELLRVLIPIYRPGVTFQPDDFAELAAILARY